MAVVARWVAAGLMMVGLSGCAVLSKPLPPGVGVREARPQRVEWNSTTFTVDAEVSNKDPKQPMIVDTADYTLSVGDIRVATGSARTKVTIEPGQTATVAFPVEVNYFRLLEAAKKRRDLITPAGEIAGTMAGVVTVHHGFFGASANFEGPVAIPLGKDAWSGAMPAPGPQTAP